LTHPNICRLIT